MPINFFKIRCKTESNELRFGLCDDPAPSANPAYIDEAHPSKWIGIVNNPSAKDIDFFAIDHCVDIFKADGRMESRCDGLLHCEKNITFVELKARGSSGWLAKARNQLTTTVLKFELNNPLSSFDKVDAYACNSLRPLANSGHNTEIQKFRDDTGLVLYAQQEINI